jgi:dTDP-glucose 4,6-dehydratase
MRYLVTGGAGFLGMNLARSLMKRGDEVVVIDNLISGRRENVKDLEGKGLKFIKGDVSKAVKVPGKVDGIYHLASIASPVFYQKYQVETLTVGARGTENVLEYAEKHKVRVLLSSTSEVYGDPLVHPQKEDYWGNVNPIGPRSMYDESKRYSEALAVAFRRQCNVDTAIVRIFNTYGLGMRPDDGRVVPTFIMQALAGKPITIHGDGSQTRSFCYVDDLITGLIAVFESKREGPYNLGNPKETTIRELAEMIIKVMKSRSKLRFVGRPQDDPERRLPDISRVKKDIGWEPHVGLEQGLLKTVEYFKSKAQG